MAVETKPDDVTSLLAPGETIVAQARPHWSALIRDALRPILVLVAALAGFIVGTWLTVTGSGIIESLASVLDTLLGVATLGLLMVGLAWLGVHAARWLRQRYLVTDRRVVNVRGVRTRSTTEARLESITSVSYRDSFLGRRLGYAKLSVVTAAGSPVDFPEVVGAAGFRQAILDAQERMLRARAGEILNGASGAQAREPAATAPPEPVQPSPGPTSPAPKRATAPRHEAPAERPAPVSAVEEMTDTLARLADLRDEGVITAEDYESKKDDLLDRL